MEIIALFHIGINSYSLVLLFCRSGIPSKQEEISKIFTKFMNSTRCLHYVKVVFKLPKMKLRVVELILVLFFLSGCEGLEIGNLNEPDFETAYSQRATIEARAGSLINSWFMTAHDYNGLALLLLVAADAGTCSWGNTRDISTEPRMMYNNHPSYAYSYQNITFYMNLYSTLNDANDLLNILKEAKLDFTDTEKARLTAVARFVQGLCLGYLGMIYDRGFVVTEETDLTVHIEVSPWKELIAEGVLSLDKAIDICNANTFILPSEYLPGEQWNSGELGRLASSFAARILVFSARNKSDDSQTDWARVYEYATHGIEKDFAPLADDVLWYSPYHTYANYSGWVQTDMYVVNMMDPSMPSRWVDENTWDLVQDPVMSHSNGVDDRIFTDYQYLSSCPFRRERGYYHFSCYRYKRLDQYLHTWTEPMPEFRKEENDYLIAEAALHTGKIGEAADLMNASSRVTRGGLPPVPADPESIGEAIHHERMVELMSSGVGIQFFQMRKEDLLQPGTLLHFPIPGTQLQIMSMEYYTFGGTEGTKEGVAGTPGIDYSTGGW